MKEFTREQAIAFLESGEWQDYTDEEIVQLQLVSQRRLCVPWEKFHTAIGNVLGRPVWSHEFANRQRLIDEYLGKRASPTLDEIVDMLPQDRVIIIKDYD